MDFLTVKISEGSSDTEGAKEAREEDGRDLGFRGGFLTTDAEAPGGEL